jgi:hypothetical protein
MFPTDFDEVLYADFPPSTQGQLGWGGHFQKYVDGLYAKQLIDTPSCVKTPSALSWR